VDALLAALTIVSFLVAIWSLYRTRREKELAATAATVVAQRIDSAAVSLQGVVAAVNAVVQIPKTRDATVAELQDVARVARAQVLVSATILKEAEALLALWQSGALLAVALGRVDVRSNPIPSESSGEESVM
jgi:hypothetical protein